MNAALRWLLVLPAAIAGSVVCFFALTLLWNVVANFNIVPQSDIISLGLANLGINALSSAVGIAAGSAIVPTNRVKGAFFAAFVSVVAALVLLALAASSSITLTISLGWHIWSTVGWVAGAIGAALSIRGSHPQPR